MSAPHNRGFPRKLLLHLSILLLLLAMSGGPSFAAPSDVRVALSRVYLPDGSESQVFRVDASITGMPLDELAGAKVTAQVWDVDGVLVGEFACHAVPESPIYYRSEPFAPPSDATSGAWKVKVTVATDSGAASSWETVAVVSLEPPGPSPAGKDVQQTTGDNTDGIDGSAAPNAPVSAASPNDASDGEEPAPTEGARSMTIVGIKPELTIGPLLFGVLIAAAVIILFVGLWRVRKPLDPVQERVKEYGLEREYLTGLEEELDERSGLSALNRILRGQEFGARLADSLTRADLPLTAAEFILLMAGVALTGLVVGTWRFGLQWGAIIGLALGFVPLLYVKSAIQKRQRSITAQLPDVLTLMVGALRAGYGLTQALGALVEQLPPPASKEFQRIARAIGLGVPVQQALSDMADRVGTDDMQLIVTAISVQYEMGGNLAETLEIAGETIRDRIRMHRQVEVLTSEERLTGIIVAALPIVVALMLFVMNPEYMMGLFDPEAPRFVRLMPVVAVCMQIGGYLMIQKIIDIEV